MTYAPRRLLDLRSYLHNRTGLPFVSLGIIGSQAHKDTGTSYHLGENDLKMWKDPYSVRTARDKAGLSNAASASDTGWFDRLVELTMWAVGEARAGRRPDTREIIGPWSDGRAYRFDHLNGWRAERRARGDSHETHMHESWYRDSEHRNKVQFYRPFFEGDGGSEGSDDDMIGLTEGDEGQDVKGLQAMLRKAGHSPGEVDGIYGPATSAAVLEMRKSMGSSAKSGKAFTGHAYAQLQDAHARRRAGQAAKKAADDVRDAFQAALADLPVGGLPARVVLDLPDTIIVPVEPAGDEDDEGGA